MSGHENPATKPLIRPYTWETCQTLNQIQREKGRERNRERDGEGRLTYLTVNLQVLHVSQNAAGREEFLAAAV